MSGFFPVWSRLSRREEKRIHEKDPMKALGIEIRREGHAVRETGFDIQFVENAVPISRAARRFRGLSSCRSAILRVRA